MKAVTSKASLACVAAVTAVALVPADYRTVMTPTVLGALTGILFLIVLSHRSRTAPVAEIGTWFVGAVTVYMVMPLGVYLLLGQQYTPLNDNRLLQIGPSPSQVAGIAWLYLTFLVSFAVFYLVARGRADVELPIRTRISRQTMGVMIGFWIGLSFLWYLVIPKTSADTYAGAYAAVAALPLGIRQLMKLWLGWGVILPLGLRVWLFQDYDRKKWLIGGWLAYDAVLAFIAHGSRTTLVLSFGSCFILYHLFVKPIRVRTAVLAALGGISIFLALGFLRAYQGLGTISQFAPGNAGGEFEALFGNAVDLQARVLSGELRSLPLSFHFADLIAPFPSQILPFEKLDPAAWYIHTFYPEFAERGEGLAFGVISQGIVGLGWVELLLRGALLGVAFGSLHKYFSRNSHRFWIVVFYIWMTVWAYQSFRDQSFILITYAVQQFLPLVLLVEGLRRMLRHTPPDYPSRQSALAYTETQGGS